MKGKVFSLLSWLLPLALIALGIFCYQTVHGHEFLGLICFCLAGGLWVLFLVLLLKKKYPRLGKILLICLLSLLTLGVAIFAVTEALILKASRGEPERAQEYVVVLGAKVNGTEPSQALRERINAAYAYLQKHPSSVAVLSGGQGQDEGISEAECMKRELTAMGISPERLYLEEKSTSTWENLEFSLALIRERTGETPESVGLVTSEFHLFRASLFAKAWGTEAVGIPAETQWVTVRINYFLREVAGVWHYILLGG